MSELGKRIGQRIRDLRTMKLDRPTQEELAERAQISVSFLSMIERGERVAHLDTLESVAHALDVSLSELFDIPEIERRKNPTKWQQVVDFIRKKRLSPEQMEQILMTLHQMFPE